MTVLDKRILLRMPNHLGDFVMALGLVRELQEAKPSWQLHMLCPTPFCDLARLVIEPHHVQPLYKGKLAQIKQLLALPRQGFDLGLLLTNSLSSAAIFSLCSVKESVGFKRTFGFWITHKIKKVTTGHQVDRYKALLAPLGVESQGLAPKLPVSEDLEHAGKVLMKRLGVTDQDKVLCIHASAIYGEAKCYPIEQHGQLIRMFLAKEVSRKVILIGTKAERESLKVLAKLDQRVINLAGLTRLHELCSVLKRVDVMVANDSGPMHLADALSVPLIALFGSSSPAATAPYRQKNRVMQIQHLACSPCFSRVCKEKHFKCMKLITPSSILERVEQTFERRGPLCLSS